MRAALFDMDRTLVRKETASLYVQYQRRVGEGSQVAEVAQRVERLQRLDGVAETEAGLFWGLVGLCGGQRQDVIEARAEDHCEVRECE